ncbi:unnamed protein product [Prorocentrum cordatum]|uniref:Uncharacterized protein n=1 Tax=Prorocentrum cordatum TaxID=2364126 RepID=A0ABN9S5F0_9DINO|nr:unnamed protein product [Polarella glacialis]
MDGPGARAAAAALRADALVDLSREASDEAVLAALAACGEASDLAPGGRGPEALALCLAAGRGDACAVERLLRAGADADAAPCFGGMTALMFAARSAHPQALELLLLRPDVCLHATTREGATALSLCRGEATRRMLAHAIADRSGDGGRYALLQACCLGHGCSLRALLAAKVDPNHADERGRSALAVAALRRHVEACEVLLAYGADPRGVSALQAAPDATIQTVLRLYHGAP